MKPIWELVPTSKDVGTVWCNAHFRSFTDEMNPRAPQHIADAVKACENCFNFTALQVLAEWVKADARHLKRPDPFFAASRILAAIQGVEHDPLEAFSLHSPVHPDDVQRYG